MLDTNTFYDIFIIYDPSDIRFVRRVDGYMKANDISCWVTWDDLSKTEDGRSVLKSGILRSHTVAIALSPKSAASQICNELIQYAVTHNKRFVTLIVDENIEIDVHPAIAENPYIFFREQDEMQQSIWDLMDVMVLDPHVELHTELLVYANDWESRNRASGMLLPLEQVDEAREWLANGANQHPKPSQLMVEYIHASRRQKSNRRWGLSIYVIMGVMIIVLIGAVVSLLQQAQDSQSLADSRSTEVAIQINTSDANAQLAESVAGSATAESIIIADFAQTATSALALAGMAVDSASTADAMQQTAQAQADTSIQQASIALTAQADAENQLVIAATESDTSATLQAQVLTAEFSSGQLVETAQAAQATSLMMAQTATQVQVSANEQAAIAQTQVANLATVEADATLQRATATAVQLESDSNAGTAIAFAQIAETESNGRSTAEAELEALNDAATETFETAQQVNSQSLILSAEQALNNGDVDLALTLALAASNNGNQSGQVYRILSRASTLSPSIILTDVSQVAYHPTTNEFAVIPLTFDRVLVYDTLTRRLKFELTGHEDTITTMEYSLDGRFLVTASQDGTIIIWSTADGTPLHEIKRQQRVINVITMHPDGDKMVTAGIRPMLALWDINTADELATYMAPQGEELLPDDLVFSSDGSRLIGWSNPRGETVMSQWAGDTLELLTADSGGRVYAGYDPSGQIAWTGGRALPAYPNDPNVGDLVLWNISNGQQEIRLTEGFNWTILSGTTIASSTDSLVFTAFYDDWMLLGVQSSDGGQRVVLLNRTNGTIQRTYQTNVTAGLTSAHFLNENTILSTTRDNHLISWSLDDGALTQQIGISTRSLQQINTNDTGQFALVQASGSEAYLWSISGTTQALAQIIPDAITGTAINQNGDRILITTDADITLRNIDTQQSLVTLESSDITRINNTGTHFATARGNQLTLYDARTGIEQQTWSLTINDIQSLAVAPSGNAIVIQNGDNTLWLARPDTTSAIQLDNQNVSPAFAMQFNGNGDVFMTLHAERAILWETSTASYMQEFPLGLPPESNLSERVKMAFGDDGNRIGFFVQLNNNIAALTTFELDSTDVGRQTFVDVVTGDFTANGLYLLLALTDNSIQIVDTTSGDVIRRLVGHTDTINAIHFQPDNNLLFSGSSDNRLIVWDVEQGTIIHQYPHPVDVRAMSINSNGDRILSLASDGIYRLWQQESLQQLIERVQASFTVRDLTCAERQQYNVLPLCE